MGFTMIRIYNDNLGRALHSVLYQRLHAFCTKYTPEFPPEPVVNTWLSRLYNSDPTFHLLVNMNDKFEITEHAVVDVQVNFNLVTVQCHQAQLDKPSISHAVELMEYLDKLKAETNAVCIVFSIADSKHAKTFEKRHNYTVFRTVLIKTSDNSESE